jgi:hypothetical protein
VLNIGYWAVDSQSSSGAFCNIVLCIGVHVYVELRGERGVTQCCNFVVSIMERTCCSITDKNKCYFSTLFFSQLNCLVFM